jgi:hypothetical protein
MPVDYSDRKVSLVTVSDLYRAIEPTGSMIVGGFVQLGLTDKDGGAFGPTARISVAVLDDGEPLEMLETRLLDAARAVLNRLLDEPEDSLRKIRRENLEEGRKLVGDFHNS